MQIGRTGQAAGGEAGGAKAHPLGGPPGQMWKQAIAEGQAGEGQVRIPPGQQKKLAGDTAAPDAARIATDEDAARASLRMDNLPPGLRMLVALAGPVNPAGSPGQAGGR